MLKSSLNTNSSWLVAFILFLSSFSAHAANTLTLDIKGTIIEQGCEIVQQDIDVTLPEIQFDKLKTTQETGEKVFSISLENCVVSSFNLSFEPVNEVTVGGKDYIVTTGTTGVVLALFDSAGTQLDFATPFASSVSSGGTYDFSVKGIALDPDAVAIGQYGATVAFTLSYN